MRSEARQQGSGTPFRLALLALPALFAVLICAPNALAAKKYKVVTQFPPSYFSPDSEEWVPRSFESLRPDAVAVDDKNHHVYVADSGRGSIYDFTSTADKTPTRWKGTNTPQGSFGEGVAVAADNTTGDIYVADREHKVIDKLDDEGNLIASFGDTTPTANGQLAGLETPAGSFSPSSGYASAFGIAVDQANHDLYVLDAGHEVIDIFNESGGYVTQITDKPEHLYTNGGEFASGIAVSSTGNVYVSSWDVPNRLFQFGPTNKYVSTWDGGQLPNGPASETPDGNFGNAYQGCCVISAGVEDATGHVIVADSYNVINLFDANGNFIPPQVRRAELGSEYLYFPRSVTVDQETGYLYVGEGSQVLVLRPVIVPDVSIAATSSVGPTTATFNGHVDPATGEGGGTVTGCQFEYLTVWEAARNEELEPFKGAKTAPCSPAMPPGYTTPEDVSASVGNLTPGTEYEVRLVVANAEGKNIAVGSHFVTVGRYSHSMDFGSGGSGDGQMEEPEDVAVSESSGDIYIADSGNNRIDQFSSSGTFIRAFGADVGGAGIDICTSGCQAGSTGEAANQLNAPRFVEVDNSGGPSTGDVYEADGANHVVHKFDATGHLITSWGTGGAFEFAKKEGPIGGITVDEAGALYVVTDAKPYNWTLLSPETGMVTAAYPTDNTWFGGERLNLNVPGTGGIEVGAGGTWYETQRPSSANESQGGVWYSSPLANEYTFFWMYPIVRGALANSGIAFDRSNHDLFVDQGGHIDRFAKAKCGVLGCVPTDTFGTGELGFGTGLAVRASNHVLYAADREKDDVSVFDRVALPEVTTTGPTNVTTTGGTMNGHVDPGAGGTVGECRFEYIPGSITNEVQELSFSGALEGKFTLEFENETTAAIQYPPGPFGAETIKYQLEQLPAVGKGNIAVRFPESGREVGPYYIEFTGRFEDLNVPQISVDDSELLPGGASATLSTKYPGNGWSYAQTAPCNPAPPLTSPTDVSASLSNLTPFTTYHYRLVAGRTDGNGFTEAGDERTFVPAPEQPPTVDASSFSELKSTSVNLNAQINPKLSPTLYRFQYGTTSGYGSQTELSAPIGEDEADHAVSQEVTELKPATTYHFRAVAINLNGTTVGPDMTFVTPDRPEVGELAVSGVTPAAATVSARVTPGFRPTTYHFEYGPTSAFGHSTTAGSLPGDDSQHQVGASITGLAPETTYFVRVVAENEVGPTEGQATTFTTQSEPRQEPPPPSCRKGYVRKHGRCVKKKAKRHRHRHRHHGRSQR